MKHRLPGPSASPGTGRHTGAGWRRRVGTLPRGSLCPVFPLCGPGRVTSLGAAQGPSERLCRRVLGWCARLGPPGSGWPRGAGLRLVSPEPAEPAPNCQPQPLSTARGSLCTAALRPPPWCRLAPARAPELSRVTPHHSSPAVWPCLSVHLPPNPLTSLSTGSTCVTCEKQTVAPDGT